MSEKTTEETDKKDVLDNPVDTPAEPKKEGKGDAPVDKKDDTGAQEGDKDRGDLNIALNKEREANSELKKKLEEYQAKEEEARQAQLTKEEQLEEKLEKANKALEDSKIQIRNAERSDDTRQIAQELGFRDPNDALAFVDVNQENWDKETVKAHLENVAENKDYLVYQDDDEDKKPKITSFGGGTRKKDEVEKKKTGGSTYSKIFS